jgi:hypothetical protein
MSGSSGPAGAAGRVRNLAPVDRASVTGTRWTRPKAVLLRVLRLVTAPQAAFNHATADALDEVAAELAACRAELAVIGRRLAELDGAADGAEVHRLRHAVLNVHGPLLVDLVDRVDGLVDTSD